MHPSFAQEDGGYAGAFLRMGLGARAKSMGDAFVPVADDIFAIFYNPAGLPFLRYNSFSLSYRFLSLDRKFSFIGYAGRIGPSGGISIGWINAGVKNIDERDFTGVITGKIDNSENGFYFSFANRIYKNFSVGISGKILYNKLYSLTAKGFGLDFGILYSGLKNFSFGLQIKDVHSRYTWNSESIYERGTISTDRFPAEFKFGASYLYLPENLLLSVEFDKNEKTDWKLKFGGEKKFFDFLFIRSGYNSSGITFGLGLKIRYSGKISFINYSFCKDNSDINFSNVFSFVVVF
ncbi:hypothetical protein DRQ09_01475 [candidate division KSB1 bacterium]|nr:MAG: hypothetical protein DRQ09_01475 [candidate division KSB1 bacterium]